MRASTLGFALRSARCNLPKSSRDIIFCPLFLGRGKNGFTFPVFDQFTLQKEGRVIGGAPCLLHGMRHEDDGVFLLEFLQRGFHFTG